MKASLVFTSPPYLNQRVYGGIGCWDTLMQRVFGALPVHETSQILVNLGLVHRDGEWLSYWDDWIEWMRLQGWRRFALYVWDKLEAVPGDHNGRLAPCFEWVFHFNRHVRYPNKTQPCKFHGETRSRRNVQRSIYGTVDARKGIRKTGSHKIDDAVFRMHPVKSNQERCGHPAIFPISLPLAVHAAYTAPGEVVYEPFSGSGTSILAAEAGGRVCMAMEIEPSYCEIAIERWLKWKDKRQAS